MNLSEYLEHAIVGDRVRVTYSDGTGLVGFVEVHGQWLIVADGPGPWTVLRGAGYWKNPHVTGIERIPLGVPA